MVPRDVQRPKGSPLREPRTFPPNDEDMDAAMGRADREGISLSHVLRTLIHGYGLGLVDLASLPVRKPSPGGLTSSFQPDAEDWELAKERAAQDGISQNQLIRAAVYGYGVGILNMPRTELIFE